MLRLGPGMTRCVMVDQPQYGVPLGPPLLTTLGRAGHLELGLQADVLRPGTIRVGDPARLAGRELG